MRRYLLVFMVLVLAMPAAAQDDQATFTSVDGRVSFAYPAGWSVEVSGLSIILTPPDSFGELRLGILRRESLGEDLLTAFEAETGQPLTGDIYAQLLADELPEIRANIEADLGTTLGVPDAVYTGPVEIAGYSGGSFTFGDRPSYIFDLPDGDFWSATLAGADTDTLQVGLEIVLETLTLTPFEFDPGAYTTAITAETAAELRLMTEYISPVSTARDLAIFPDGERLAVASGGDVYILAIQTAEILQIIRPEDYPIRTIDLHPDGTQIAAGGDVPTAEGQAEISGYRLYDATTGDLLQTVRSDSTLNVESIGYNPDGTLIALNAGDLFLYDAETGAPAIMLDGARDHFAFSPDGTQIAAGCPSQGARVCVYGLADGEITLRILDEADEFPRLYESISFTPDGQMLVIGYTDFGERMPLVFWSMATGDVATIAAGGEDESGGTDHRDGVTDIVFDPTGALIVTTGLDGDLRGWQAADGNGLFVVEDAHGSFGFDVNKAVFNPAGTLLFTAGDDGTVRVWAVD